MRTESEMMDLILGTARRDPRIRAVYMNGSRANPNAPGDIFQDYDIVYVVTETASFLGDSSWINVFGKLLIKQEPDLIDRILGKEMDFSRSYGYLMLFSDGNRIDLHIQTKEAMLAEYGRDSLTLPLLDKDGCLPPIPPPTERDYLPQMPSSAVYESCCNEFWWCLQNVAKGIWRGELPYAKEMLEGPVRAMLNQMAVWQIGVQHGFLISAGKFGKYFSKYLSYSHWAQYEKTYSGSDPTDFWESVFSTCGLFRSLAADVADSLGFAYPWEEDKNMTDYLLRVRALPSDAKEIYP